METTRFNTIVPLPTIDVSHSEFDLLKKKVITNCEGLKKAGTSIGEN